MRPFASGNLEWIDGCPTIFFQPWIRLVDEIEAQLADDPEALGEFIEHVAAFMAEERRLLADWQPVREVDRGPHYYDPVLHELSQVGIAFQHYVRRSHPGLRTRTVRVTPAMVLGLVIVVVAILGLVLALAGRNR